VTKDTLVLCDIDETVLTFKGVTHEWWNANIEKHGHAWTYDQWEHIARTNPPEATDPTGFQTMVRNSGKLIFVTARKKHLMRLTEEHLSKVTNQKWDVLFCGTESKGRIIKEHLDLSPFDRVVFIDDSDRHLQTVRDEFGDAMEFYKFHAF